MLGLGFCMHVCTNLGGQPISSFMRRIYAITHHLNRAYDSYHREPHLPQPGSLATQILGRMYRRTRLSQLCKSAGRK